MLAAYNPSTNIMYPFNNRREHALHTPGPVASYPSQLDHTNMVFTSSWQADNAGHPRYGAGANGFVNDMKGVSPTTAFPSTSPGVHSRSHYDYASSERSTMESFQQEWSSPSLSPQSIHTPALPTTNHPGQLYHDTYRQGVGVGHHASSEWPQWPENTNSHVIGLRTASNTSSMTHWANGDLRAASFTAPQSIDDLLPSYSLPPIPTRGYEMSPIPSPSPSPSISSQRLSPQSSVSPTPSSRRASVDGSSGKKCSHCQATSTPLWRREPTTLKPLCNACGLYLQQRHRHRPKELIDADQEDDESEEEDQNYNGPKCSHCHTHRTSVWRRSKTGAQLCNACGVYARLRGKDRPLSLKRKKIKPRTKHASTSGSRSP
ncbi:hypothetical protein P691DRAFT_710680 [Macrolepiota fuliginosa MF-IS2]|uniref:GATA-type domain-containing protein n=1 Tax=Macrolepiota fuliginosa MF-IS2 TaxID=1400762 RepID=A0A9P5X6Y6_9AGAR|nr:hypothetical protein P691DRAFT_710680 [Macrolepiota fuliginosa MF-IS2]